MHLWLVNMDGPKGSPYEVHSLPPIGLALRLRPHLGWRLHPLA